jgi:nitroimidazol reductase NimA-like FMN-containing flavoprotein (pyridoxamine 5'-phosphate oxidase superfamily)
MSDLKANTPDTRVKRGPELGRYDRAAVDEILDSGIVCHVGWIHDEHPVVIPTLFARVGDDILIHGSSAGRTPRGLRAGAQLCLEVTLLDGLVLARSIFNHSVNYRSVVLYGTAEQVDDPEQKLAALEAFSEKLLPGRWADARPPNAKELRATSILRMPIESYSAKVSEGGPEDDEADLTHPAWSGVVPLSVVREDPIPVEGLDWSGDPPSYVKEGPPTRPTA